MAQLLAERRAALLAAIRREVPDERVLAAMAAVERAEFVPPSLAGSAWDNSPLPIGEGQTISQPLIVAMMTAALGLTGSERVLEVGTGSGYQAAVLSRLAAQVVTVEVVPSLAQSAALRLARLGYRNVQVHQTGATLGWPEGAPYDAIIVAAAAPGVPQTLVDQLAPGGRLVIPAGARDEQDLLVVTKHANGATTRRSLGGCRFVPLIGHNGWPAAQEA